MMGFMDTPLAVAAGNLGGLGAARGHADLGRAVDDGGDAGGRALGGDLEGHAGVAGLVVFGEHGHELGPKGVGALDDELLGGGRGNGAQGGEKEDGLFHGRMDGWLVR
jgi:hypothetical protein